jgi:hypothetical protein
MKRIAAALLPLGIAGGLAGAAMAQTLPEVEDADGNGTWSLMELQAVWPELTEDGFGAVDTNADGTVDPMELQTALDNGVLTPVDG